MAKSAKTKAAAAPKKKKPSKADIPDLISEIQQKLVLIEMKVDVLIERLTIKPVEKAPQTVYVQAAAQPQRQAEHRHANGNNARTMYAAVCADCGEDCEVPFKPRENRAVYCKECFAKRRSGGAPKANGNVMPQEATTAPEPQPKAEEGGKKRKSPEKKKAVKKAKKK